MNIERKVSTWDIFYGNIIQISKVEPALKKDLMISFRNKERCKKYQYRKKETGFGRFLSVKYQCSLSIIKK